MKQNKIGQLKGWSVGFAISGFILTPTGGHMTLSWVLAEIRFPFDDIIFGEPSLAFGVMLLGISVLLWRKSNIYMKHENILCT